MFDHRIGYWWSDKKAQKFNPEELRALFAERNCEFVKLDLERPLDEQGPFSLIVHKISDILVKALQGDKNAEKIIVAFEKFARNNPQTVILDPLDNNRSLLDRYEQYKVIEQSVLAKEGVLFSPSFVHLTSNNIDVNRGRIKRSNLTFPIVCKPILAQGSQVAHQMCIIFNEAGLKDVKPPCVAQSFVNHNAKLFKMFVIKDRYYIMERPSLKNFQAGDHETVFFFSHDISKPNSSSSLTELDEVDKLRLQEKLSQISIASSEPDQIKCNIGSCQDSTMKHDHSDDNVNIDGIESGRNYNSEDNNKSADVDRPSQGESELDSITTKTSGEPIRLLDQCPPIEQVKLWPNKDKLDKIVSFFSEKLGLTFYGLDIIIENHTSRYAIIDMNTFPGYDGVDNFLTVFRDVICESIPKRTIDANEQASNLQQSLNMICTAKLMNNQKRKPNEIDSGIEST